MIKPDIVEEGLYPEIISLVLKNRFEIKRMTMMSFSREKAELFYEIHKGKEFFRPLIDYVTSNKVVAMELEGDSIIEEIRSFIGATDPALARPGTIRYMYGKDIQCNAVHASDSPESAKKEIAIAFGE